MSHVTMEALPRELVRTIYDKAPPATRRAIKQAARWTRNDPQMPAPRRFDTKMWHADRRLSKVDHMTRGSAHELNELAALVRGVKKLYATGRRDQTVDTADFLARAARAGGLAGQSTAALVVGYAYDLPARATIERITFNILQQAKSLDLYDYVHASDPEDLTGAWARGKAQRRRRYAPGVVQRSQQAARQRRVAGRAARRLTSA